MTALIRSPWRFLRTAFRNLKSGNRTGWAALTALGLVALSAGIYLSRWYTVGSDAEQMGAASAWKITLAAAGELAANESSLTMALPPDFRRQHVFDESFQIRELLQRPR